MDLATLVMVTITGFTPGHHMLDQCACAPVPGTYATLSMRDEIAWALLF